MTTTLNVERVEQEITCQHPVTGEILTFPAKGYAINGYRSHHPVIIFSDGTVDHEDYFYRVLDKYNGPIVARYDRMVNEVSNEVSLPQARIVCQYPIEDREEREKRKILHIHLMSFDDWKTYSPRICTNSWKKRYTFQRMVAQVEGNDVAPDSCVFEDVFTQTSH